MLVNANELKRNKRFKKDRLLENDFEIPKYEDYEKINNTGYSVSNLKEICKYYKLKVSGNKNELKIRIYDYLYKSFFVIKIQKNMRKFFITEYLKLLGPGYYKRHLCKNDRDFLTYENIKDIKIYDFFTIISSDGSLWAFNIISLYNLFIKSDGDILNPYTREKIDYSIFQKIKKLLKLSKILKFSLNIKLNSNTDNITQKKILELKCLDLFQRINRLGNYSDNKWFLALNRSQIVKFLLQLNDIWNYRAQLSYIVKKKICAPYGNPFRHINLSTLNTIPYFSIQKNALHVIEQLITKGISNEFSNLGASYVLCSLTLVNSDAANALPWLYESVVV